MEHLKEYGNIYDGLPVVCSQHPYRRPLLKTPADFDIECPDGGCDRPWYALPSAHFPSTSSPLPQRSSAKLQVTLLSVQMSPTLTTLGCIVKSSCPLAARLAIFGNGSATAVLVPPPEHVRSYSGGLPKRLKQKHPHHWSREKSGGGRNAQEAERASYPQQVERGISKTWHS